MEIKNTDLVSLFEQRLRDIPTTRLDEIGLVIQVGDGICTVHGLLKACYGELVDFEHGNKGMILGLEQEFVSIFLLSNTIPVKEGERVARTGEVFKTPVSDQFLGRVISAQAEPIDGHLINARCGFELLDLIRAEEMFEHSFQTRVFNSGFQHSAREIGQES